MAIRARSNEPHVTSTRQYVIPAGKLEVTPRVIAKIAATAVRNTEGVSGPAGLMEDASSNAPSWWPFSADGKAISARVHGDRATLKVNIETEYGQQIPMLAEAVRTNIRARVAQIAGVDVQRVDVRVTDTAVPDEDDGDSTADAGKSR